LYSSAFRRNGPAHAGPGDLRPAAARPPAPRGWRRGLALLAAAALALGGCGWLDRVFDPVDDDAGRLIELQPRFPTLEVGLSVELGARLLDDPDAEPVFVFTEDSGGRVVQIFPVDDTRVLVTGLAPGTATVTASFDGDEGVAVVTVR
jgi:hypothetical protein